MNMDMTYGMTADFSCETRFVFHDIKLTECYQTAIACVTVVIASIIIQYFINKEQLLFAGFKEKCLENNFSSESEKNKNKLLLTLLRLLILVLSTYLMFAVMTYDLWFTVSMALAYPVGYFLFVTVKGRKVEALSCCQIS